MLYDPHGITICAFRKYLLCNTLINDIVHQIIFLICCQQYCEEKAAKMTFGIFIRLLEQVRRVLRFYDTQRRGAKKVNNDEYVMISLMILNMQNNNSFLNSINVYSKIHISNISIFSFFSKKDISQI